MTKPSSIIHPPGDDVIMVHDDTAGRVSLVKSQTKPVESAMTLTVSGTDCYLDER